MAGRPRSEASRCSILETALALAREDYAALTIDRIAAGAGVGKQTIYRWWPSKAAVVLEAVGENARAEIEVPDTGSLRSDLAGFLSSTFATLRRRPGLQDVLRALMAEAQLDPSFAVEFRREVVDPRREVLRGLFDRARQRGEVSEVRDLWVDVAFGVMWYRLLTDVGPVGDALAVELADLMTSAATIRTG